MAKNTSPALDAADRTQGVHTVGLCPGMADD
jgi:hypothetical protein